MQDAYEKNCYAICSGLGTLETTLKGVKVYQRGAECLGVCRSIIECCIRDRDA